MSYWTGTQEAVQAAADAAFAAYIAAHPTATQDGDVIENPTTAWDIPRETATAGVWAIMAYDGIAVPEGCAVVVAIDWPEADL